MYAVVHVAAPAVTQASSDAIVHDIAHAAMIAIVHAIVHANTPSKSQRRAKHSTARTCGLGSAVDHPRDSHTGSWLLFGRGSRNNSNNVVAEVLTEAAVAITTDLYGLATATSLPSSVIDGWRSA